MNVQEAINTIDKMKFFDKTKIAEIIEQIDNPTEVKILNRSDILIVLSSFLDCDTLEEAINQVEANPSLKIQISGSLDN